MSGNYTSNSPSRIEEVRGLFVLGLLAVVASIRIQNTEIILAFNGDGFNVTIFLDVMIFLWSFYAFFMVLGQSTDMFEEKISSAFKQTSRQLLMLSFIILTILGSALFYDMYPTRAPWVLPFIVLGLGYYIVKKAYRIVVNSRKKLSSDEFELKKSLSNKWVEFKATAYQYFLSLCMVCLILVIYGNYEEWVIPSSIIGAIFLVLYLIFKDRKTRNEKMT